jgi:hypothetical protein
MVKLPQWAIDKALDLIPVPLIEANAGSAALNALTQHIAKALADALRDNEGKEE